MRSSVMSQKSFLLLISLLFFYAIPVLAKQSSWVESEKIGEFAIGLSEKSLKKKLNCKFKRNKEIHWEADGLYHQAWHCKASGIRFSMISERKGGRKKVDNIIIMAPSKLKTKRGIEIGSTEKQVIQAYKDVKDAKSSVAKEVFVAGSVYGGLFFSFQDGKVTSIMLGAGAE